MEIFFIAELEIFYLKSDGNSVYFDRNFSGNVKANFMMGCAIPNVDPQPFQNKGISSTSTVNISRRPSSIISERR